MDEPLQTQGGESIVLAYAIASVPNIDRTRSLMN